MHLFLIDGTYELFRAHFGAPPSRSPKGQEVGATLGLLRSLISLLRSEQPLFVAAAFDTVIESFRNELFSGYKTGDGIEPELHEQFPLAEEATRALGITTWSMVEYEADDALATAAHQHEQNTRITQIRICSPDKDLTQCVKGDRVVCVDRRRESVLDESAAVARYGIHPQSIPDWLALVGDSADGIPGVPRWGAKSASAVLSVYSHLEAIPADPRAWQVSVRGREALAESLKTHQPQVALYKTLATLRRDVPLPETLDQLEWKGADIPRLSALLQQLGGERLIETVPIRPA